MLYIRYSYENNGKKFKKDVGFFKVQKVEGSVKKYYKVFFFLTFRRFFIYKLYFLFRTHIFKEIPFYKILSFSLPITYVLVFWNTLFICITFFRLREGFNCILIFYFDSELTCCRVRKEVDKIFIFISQPFKSFRCFDKCFFYYFILRL